jgi:lycopene beta-cyclase
MVYDYVFVGGGLSAGLAALALLEHRPECAIAVVERETALGGNHTWCFHAADLPPGAARFIEPLVVRRWDEYEVRFPNRTRRLHSAYACVSSERLHAVLSQRLNDAPRGALILGAEALSCHAHQVVLADGRLLDSRMVVDARGPVLPRSSTDSGYQKFVGLELEVEADHSLECPILFDACVRQADGFRFMYLLPFERERVLFEETYFSDSPLLDETRCESTILAYAKAQGFRVRGIVRREHGVLPMPWRRPAKAKTRGVIEAGFRAGLFHPVTGYSFPLAARFAQTLATASEPRAALDELAKRHDEQLAFLLLLSRALFTCFPPSERYRVLEHFYRLPEAVIERFYSAELTLIDRARILSGAPPRGMSFLRAFKRRQVSS